MIVRPGNAVYDLIDQLKIVKKGRNIKINTNVHKSLTSGTPTPVDDVDSTIDDIKAQIRTLEDEATTEEEKAHAIETKRFIEGGILQTIESKKKPGARKYGFSDDRSATTKGFELSSTRYVDFRS